MIDDTDATQASTNRLHFSRHRGRKQDICDYIQQYPVWGKKSGESPQTETNDFSSSHNTGGDCTVIKLGLHRVTFKTGHRVSCGGILEVHNVHFDHMPPYEVNYQGFVAF